MSEPTGLGRALQTWAADLADTLDPGTAHPEKVAATWVYLTVLLAWAEDHALIDPWLRRPAKVRLQEFLARDARGMAGWLAHAFAALAVHPSTWCLLDSRYSALRDGTPSQEALTALVHWWTDDAPSLAFDVEAGPRSLSGWLPGELLPAVADWTRRDNALCQTPWWVADLILEQTLIPAAAERTDQTLLLIDPTCGTGHFLVRGIDYLHALYTTGALAPRQARRGPVAGGWHAVPPAVSVQRILTGLHGVELDPLTAAVARLRCTVAIASLLTGTPPRLDAIPWAIRPTIVVGDSLLLGVATFEEYRAIHPLLAGIYQSETELFGTVAWPEQDRAS